MISGACNWMRELGPRDHTANVPFAASATSRIVHSQPFQMEPIAQQCCNDVPQGRELVAKPRISIRFSPAGCANDVPQGRALLARLSNQHKIQHKIQHRRQQPSAPCSLVYKLATAFSIFPLSYLCH